MKLTLSEKNFKDMAECIKDTLNQIGIDVNVDLKVGEKKEETTLNFTTSKFNVTPRIFKSVWCYGDAYIEADDNNNDENSFYTITFSIYYRWTYFDGGTNGTFVGKLPFTISNMNNYQRLTNYGLQLQECHIPLRIN